jgi:hypothetical protein
MQENIIAAAIRGNKPVTTNVVETNNLACDSHLFQSLCQTMVRHIRILRPIRQSRPVTAPASGASVS